jgi:hypothetical protein
MSAFSPAKLRFLGEYPYFSGGLSASDYLPRHLKKFVRETIGFQARLAPTSILSPTVMFESFDDQWYQIALNFADSSLEYRAENHPNDALLLSFVIGEEALISRRGIDRFLDTITQEGWNMNGFYLIIARRDSVYNQSWDAVRLANLLYLIYVLSRINGLRVVVGYTDFYGLLLRAAGADAFATGWSQTLRYFARKNFLLKPPGGQPPRERYSSTRLMNSIFVLTELEDIFTVGRLNDVLSGVPLDSVITNAASPFSAPWTQGVAHQHHWQSLSKLDRSITGRVRQDLVNVVRQVREAQALYTALEQLGVEFERFNGKDHLADWARAISEFERLIA